MSGKQNCSAYLNRYHVYKMSKSAKLNLSNRVGLLAFDMSRLEMVKFNFAIRQVWILPGTSRSTNLNHRYVKYVVDIQYFFWAWVFQPNITLSPLSINWTKLIWFKRNNQAYENQEIPKFSFHVFPNHCFVLDSKSCNSPVEA